MTTLGTWRPGADGWAGFAPADLRSAVGRPREAAHVVRYGEGGPLGLAFGGERALAAQTAAADALPWLATLPPLYPEWLGDRAFNEAHGVRFPYVAGAMANGISTVELVVAMARAQMLGFFGAGGLEPSVVADAVERIQHSLGDASAQGGECPLAWGSNLIHSPQDPQVEAAVAELYIQRGVRRVSASAYMKLTAPLVRYAASGLRALPDGRVLRRHHVFAKISRPELTELFCAPAPQALLSQLVSAGQLSAPEAELAARVPVASEITAEADSGGHTDNRPLGALLPSVIDVRDATAARHGTPAELLPRVGAAGGLGTPSALAAAFAAGAAYVLTGSVNQACREAGLAEDAKSLLAEADMADVVMAPSPDMFELGVSVQVLRRGTLFAQRAAQLYEVYRSHDGLEALAPELRQRLEREIFQDDLDRVWNDTQAFFAKRNPTELARAKGDPKHRMALVFRWYVGKSSRWAIAGNAARRLDYQIWCGPAMGAFNRWTRDSFLEDPAHRDVAAVALNLLEGATVISRAAQLRTAGLPLPPSAFDFRPRPLGPTVVAQ